MRVDRPAAGARASVRSRPPAWPCSSSQAFRGALYAGTGDADAGYGVWRARRAPRRTWRPVVTGRRGPRSARSPPSSPWRRTAAASTSGERLGHGRYPPSELVRIAPDGGWEVVAGNPRPDAARRAAHARSSGLPDGFGNAFNSHFWRMQAYRGALLLGTNDWSWSVGATPELVDGLRRELGFDLYATCDGDALVRPTRDAFGRGGQDFGVRTMAATRAGLFLGTTNHVRGAAVYRTRRDLCVGRRPVPARPRASATAALRSGLKGCPPGAEVLADAATTRDEKCGRGGTGR